MTDERFNRLVNGPLSHPLPMFRISRLATALRHVVEATGKEGEKALEDFCRDRAERDALDDAEEYDDDDSLED
jgi:hypothetical protein